MTLDECFDRYISLFFTGDALKHMLVYMCNACTLEVSDPVPSTLSMFLSSNVTLAVTKIGLMPFKDMPMAVYPYTQMNVQQKQFLLEYLDAIRKVNAGTVSTQMGGGCVVALNKKTSRIYYLNHSDVLCLFCLCVMENESHSCIKTRLAVCNIVLQRLGATIGISRDTLQRVYTSVLDANVA